MKWRSTSRWQWALIGTILLIAVGIALTGCSSNPRDDHYPPQVAPCADGHIPTYDKMCEWRGISDTIRKRGW